MDYYFLVITIIDVFVMAILCILTASNETLSSQKRECFIVSFILIIVISILELTSVAVNNGPEWMRWINVISNYLGFGLTPAVPIFLAAALDNNKLKKYSFAAEAAFLVILAVTYPMKPVFYVDGGNHYSRGEFFVIYIAAYVLAVIYLLFITLKVAKMYSNRKNNSIYLIALFLLSGSFVQVIFPGFHVSWLCASLLSILYYIYCNGLWQQLDELTGLLNQKSYLNHTDEILHDGTMAVFDVNDFKLINDTHGHLAGDKCLREIASAIKYAYSKHGLCYRIGGDEFCVILDEKADTERCLRMFNKELESRKKRLSFLPDVSIGYAEFKAGDNALEVKETADNDMYRNKKKNKSRKNSLSYKYIYR
ncbi:MAG: GGDEF domain-containing protein [Bacillota bacterium]|nr:GGDEF domain-containing protein [Bacillota bacterium]